jgi:hypothetical protein
MKYFKCINSDDGLSLTNGKIYVKVDNDKLPANIQYYFFNLYVLDDNGNVTGWFPDRFIDVSIQELRKKKLDEIL